MQFTSILITAILALTVTAAPQLSERQTQIDLATVDKLVPAFGNTKGTFKGPGPNDCASPFAPPTVAIPCDCPPDRPVFIQALTTAAQSGKTFDLPAPFPTGQDKPSQIARLQTMLSVMQNIRGAKGNGCPAVATSFKKTLDGLTGAAPGGAGGR
jgi:hypothetical protein